MMKSNHSKALPIDAAATARQRRAWYGCSVVMPIRSPDLNEYNPDGRQPNGCPLQAADGFTQYQHRERAAKNNAALAQRRDQADRPVDIGPHPAYVGEIGR